MINLLIRLGLLKRNTGLVPQEDDKRDYLYRAAGITMDAVDMRPFIKPVTSQNGYNSCTSHAVCALLDYTLANHKQIRAWQEFNSSEAYLWYWSRARLGTEDENSGAILRDCFKDIMDYGFVPEEFWNYYDGIYNAPNLRAQTAGSFFKKFLPYLPAYYSITPKLSNTVEKVKNALSNDHPVVFGIPVDTNFQRLRKSNSFVSEIAYSQSYHAMLIVGYTNEGFIIRNSWNRSWGDDGHCIIAFDLFQKKAFDIWTLM